MNVETGAEAAQFPQKEYKNGMAVAVHIPMYDYALQISYYNLTCPIQ